MANPNPDTSGLAPKWEKGQSGNPGGKSAAHRKAEVEAAEKAAKLRLDMVNALAEMTDGDVAALVEAIKGDNLKLLKDSEDRGFGAPTQPVDHGSSDGSMRPTVISFEAPDVDKGDDQGTAEDNS